MTEEPDTGDLTPPDIDHTHLPDQTMYKLAWDAVTHFEQGGEDVVTYPLVITNEFKLLYFEMAPGATIDWHTHTPGFDEVCLCLDGEARYTLEQEDGSHQTVTIEPRESVYLPGGARHKIDAVGDERHEGLVAKVIGGHWGLVPALQKLAIEGRIQAWNLPQGVISHLFRDIAAGKPGTLTRVGLGTFVDPRLGGGRINDVTLEERVSLLPIDGQEYLFYRALPLQVALLRGTTADTLGNVSMEREALTLEALAIATAVRNSGGVVIVQVERLAEHGTLHPKDVKIPGLLVDCVVVCEDPAHHWQTFNTAYNPAYSGEIRAPMATPEPLPLSARKIIARRAAFELRPNSVVNLGIGMPEGVGAVASEERLLEHLSYEAPDRDGDAIDIDAAYVDEQLSELVGDDDLSRYIL